MADYAEIEAALDEIIGRGDGYFNSLNIRRDALTFVESNKGGDIRLGKRGNWLVPNIKPMQTRSLRFLQAIQIGLS
jgi:hypothetical protein